MYKRMQKPLDSIHLRLQQGKGSFMDLMNFIIEDTTMAKEIKQAICRKLDPVRTENEVQLQLTWALQMMLKDLCDLSAIRAKVFKPNEYLASPKQVLMDVIQRYDSRSGNVEIKTNLNNADRTMMFDASRFAQVFTTLLQNALKYTHSG